MIMFGDIMDTVHAVQSDGRSVSEIVLTDDAQEQIIDDDNFVEVNRLGSDETEAVGITVHEWNVETGPENAVVTDNGNYYRI